MKRFNDVLCAVDTEISNDVALVHAAEMAEKNQVGLKQAIAYANPKTHFVKDIQEQKFRHFLKIIGRTCGNRGCGVSGFFMGNTTESVLNQLDYSALTIKPRSFVTPVSQDS